MKIQAKMEKLMKNQYGKSGKIMEIAISASATQLILYGLDVRNYSKINESNFIGDIDELWIGDNAGWYNIVEF